MNAGFLRILVAAVMRASWVGMLLMSSSACLYDPGDTYPCAHDSQCVGPPGSYCDEEARQCVFPGGTRPARLEDGSVTAPGDAGVSSADAGVPRPDGGAPTRRGILGSFVPGIHSSSGNGMTLLGGVTSSPAAAVSTGGQYRLVGMTTTSASAR